MTCKARQYNDEYHCGRCGLIWDVNDPDPPECKNKLALPETKRILTKNNRAKRHEKTTT